MATTCWKETSWLRIEVIVRNRGLDLLINTRLMEKTSERYFDSIRPIIIANHATRYSDGKQVILLYITVTVPFLSFFLIFEVNARHRLFTILIVKMAYILVTAVSAHMQFMSPYMGIPYEIDDATIAIDETTILGSNRRFDLENISRNHHGLTSKFCSVSHLVNWRLVFVEDEFSIVIQSPNATRQNHFWYKSDDFMKKARRNWDSRYPYRGSFIYIVTYHIVFGAFKFCSNFN